nr:TrbC/VirB2 family protein [Bacillus sp. SH7-1]
MKLYKRKQEFKMDNLLTVFYVKLLTYNDFFESVSSAMTSWTGKLQAIGLAIVIFCVAIAGVMYMLGEEMSRKAKQWLFRIIVGAIILFCAATIGDTITAVSGFTSN